MSIGLIWTDSGMFALWDPASFRGIVGYDTWDASIGEDDRIQRHVAAGAFIPINIKSDGAFSACVRVGTPYESARLTAREAPYEVVRSSRTYSYPPARRGSAASSGLARPTSTTDSLWPFRTVAGS